MGGGWNDETCLVRETLNVTVEAVAVEFCALVFVNKQTATHMSLPS